MDKSTIDRYISQQEQMLDLLDKAKLVDLSKTKTTISISKLIKWKLRDTFKMVIYHSVRHFVQAKKVIVL